MVQTKKKTNQNQIKSSKNKMKLFIFLLNQPDFALIFDSTWLLCAQNENL